MKKLIILIFISILFFAGCDQKNEYPKENTITIGVFLLTEHQVIDEIYSGFKQEVEKEAKVRNLKVQFIEKNANADQMQMDNISNFFITSKKIDIIFAVGTPAAKILKDKGCQKPVIFGGPPAPIKAGLVSSLENHNSNFTGTTYFPPTKAILEVFLQNFPNAKTFAVLRNPAEPNSAAVANSFISNVKELNKTIIDLPSMDGTQVDASLRTLFDKKVDGLFIPTDNLVYSMLDKVLATTKEIGIPVFSCTRLSVMKGALFSIGTDYVTVGQITAKVSLPIIFEDKSPKDIDVYKISEGFVYVNKNSAHSNEFKEYRSYKVEKVK